MGGDLSTPRWEWLSSFYVDSSGSRWIHRLGKHKLLTTKGPEPCHGLWWGDLPKWSRWGACRKTLWGGRCSPWHYRFASDLRLSACDWYLYRTRKILRKLIVCFWVEAAGWRKVSWILLQSPVNCFDCWCLLYLSRLWSACMTGHTLASSRAHGQVGLQWTWAGF